MNRSGKELYGSLPASLGAAMAILAIATTPLNAQQNAPITLESNDGSMSITGQLLSFEENLYIVETEDLGTLQIQADNVTCTGILCPTITESFGPEFGIYGSRTVGTTLIPNLLRGYAKSVDATYEIVATDEAAERIVRLTHADGTLRAEIDLQTRGSGSAFPALADGFAAIGVADRRMKDSDVEKIAAAGIPDLRDTADETVLGVDGIVMIANPDNPVRNLTSLEISKIWSGEITNWLELGGGDVPITVNSFGEGSGDRAVMMDALVRPNGRDETVDVVRWSAYQDMVDAVVADRGGIGFVGRWLARMRLEDMGMMLVHTAAVEPDFNGAQYSDMMQQLRGADRLSVSFRFNTGSSTLDVESIRNVEELAVRLEAGEFEGMEVLLAGFADSIGERTRNTELAQQRAEAVRSVLTRSLSRENAQRLVPVSYGELLPLSCNEDEVGRERNRRVEVWLRLPNSRTVLR